MHPWALRALFAFDRLRVLPFRARFRHGLHLEPPVSPNLRLTHLRIEPGARLEVGRGFATERQRGNRIWVQSGGRLRLEPEVWLRTEYGPNHLTVFPGASMHIGTRSLLNGAMIHATTQVTLGSEVLLGFGTRILDSDLHDLDSVTPKRSEPVRIGSRVWIGAGALVLRGVTIGDDSVVGAGSIVTSDLPPRVLALGSPARPVRELASREGCD